MPGKFQVFAGEFPIREHFYRARREYLQYEVDCKEGKTHIVLDRAELRKSMSEGSCRGSINYEKERSMFDCICKLKGNVIKGSLLVVPVNIDQHL